MGRGVTFAEVAGRCVRILDELTILRRGRGEEEQIRALYAYTVRGGGRALGKRV
jgi:hypothetical protein